MNATYLLSFKSLMQVYTYEYLVNFFTSVHRKIQMEECYIQGLTKSLHGTIKHTRNTLHQSTSKDMKEVML